MRKRKQLALQICKASCFFTLTLDRNWQHIKKHCKKLEGTACYNEQMPDSVIVRHPFKQIENRAHTVKQATNSQPHHSHCIKAFQHRLNTDHDQPPHQDVTQR